MATTVTNKGQVTIPKRIRDRLGIEPGTAVDFVIDRHGRVVLVKSEEGDRPPSRSEMFRGFAGAGLCTDDIMTMTRGEGAG